MSSRRRRGAAAVLLAVVVLSSCRVEVTTHLAVKPNGSGTITVTALADKGVVAKAPELTTDLRFDDAVNAGWKVDGPTPTKDGGYTLTLSHSFATPAIATALLAQLNGTKGPFHDMSLSRSGKDTDSTWSLNGRLEVNGGLEAFVDDNTLTLLGGAPYANAVKRANIDLGDAVGLNFTASLPGSVKSTTAAREGGTLTWRIPMDGTPTELSTTTVNLDVASTIARVVKPVLLVLMLLVLLLMLFLLSAISRAQRRRTPRF